MISTAQHRTEFGGGSRWAEQVADGQGGSSWAHPTKTLFVSDSGRDFSECTATVTKHEQAISFQAAHCRVALGHHLLTQGTMEVSVDISACTRIMLVYTSAPANHEPALTREQYERERTQDSVVDTDVDCPLVLWNRGFQN
jgi:hypothetical protein